MWVCNLVSAKLSVFESSVLIKIFMPKREEVSDDWIELHNEYLRALYLSPNVRVISQGG
jgi:hypothetical protein